VGEGSPTRKKSRLGSKFPARFQGRANALGVGVASGKLLKNSKTVGAKVNEKHQKAAIWGRGSEAEGQNDT